MLATRFMNLRTERELRTWFLKNLKPIGDLSLRDCRYVLISDALRRHVSLERETSGREEVSPSTSIFYLIVAIGRTAERWPRQKRQSPARAELQQHVVRDRRGAVPRHARRRALPLVRVVRGHARHARAARAAREPRRVAPRRVVAPLLLYPPRLAASITVELESRSNFERRTVPTAMEPFHRESRRAPIEPSARPLR